MAKKRKTPDDDYDRAAQNLWKNYGTVIRDRTTFERAFSEYFETDIIDIDKDVLSDFKDKVFRSMRRRHPDVSEGRLYATQAVSKAPEVKKKPKKFRYVGKVRNKIVFTRRIITKSGERFIDRKGRYVKVDKSSIRHKEE